MRCTVTLHITANQFFTCIEDQLLLDLKLNAKRKVQRESLTEGFSYTKEVGKRSFTVSILAYKHLELFEIQEENDTKRSRTRYQVESLDNGRIRLTMETTLLTRRVGMTLRDGKPRFDDDSNNLVLGQSALAYRHQLKNLERHIRKKYAALA